MEIFNEQKLRAEIAKTWGEHGAHIEVYDMLLKKANAVLPQTDVSGSLQDRLFKLANDFAVDKQGDVAVKLHIIHNGLQ